MDLTRQQQKAIDPKLAGRDTCIVAGPGSGKTLVLVERYQRLMIDSRVSPQRLLAITFTEKAARNMKERLAKSLRGHPERRRELEQASVSTIHGFCARLLRENSVAAGVDPEFRVLDARQATIMQRKAATDALDRMLAEQPDAMTRLMRGLSSPDLADKIPDVYDAMRCAGERPQNLRRYAPGGPGASDLRRALEDLANESTAGWNPIQLGILHGAINAALRIVRLPEANITADHLRVISEFPTGLKGIKRNTPAGDRIMEIKDSLIPEIKRTWTTRYYSAERETLIAVLECFDRLYSQRKRQMSALDYSDLEWFTVRLLEENSGLRERIRQDFEHVLMDEFQDTNNQQSKLLELVRGPGRFYVVGDINQSIYGFRHADPEVFRGYRDTVEGDHLVELAENWRSRPDILRAVETILANAPGIEPRALIAAKEFPKKLEPSIEILAAIADSQEAALDLEAQWVARRILELAGKLQVAERRAGFGDIAVLVRNTEVLPVFTRAFGDAGIPYLLNQGKGFFETREVVDLTNLLRVVANPRDEISLAAVLRSPFTGCSDETLFRLKIEGSLATAIHRLDQLTQPFDAEEAGRLRRFREQLRRWREARDVAGLDRLLIRALDETGYGADPGSRALANIEKFLALAREASTRLTLAEFVEELELMREADARDADAPPEDAVNAVRIMTVHAAKGLEFPVVFLAALQKGIQSGAGQLAFSPRVGLGVSWIDPASGESKRDWFLKTIEDEGKRREKEEGNRLFYVAMTRAEEHLVFSFSSFGKRKEWAATLETAIGEDLGIPHNKVRRVDAPNGESFLIRLLATKEAPSPLARPNVDPASTAVERLARPAVRDQHDSAASVTSIALYADCPRRYYLERYLGWRAAGPRHMRVNDEDAVVDKDQDASEFGREVHSLLAGEKIENATPEALKLADVFRASEIGRRASCAARVEREFDFLMAVDDAVLRGQIDLWFEEGGELVLVDYKTDDVKNRDAAAQAEIYAPQLRLYAMALERVTGRVPDKAFVFFLRPGLAVPVSLERNLLNNPDLLVAEFREAQASLQFPLREGEHCARCPYFRGLCPAGSAMADVIHPPTIDSDDLGGDETGIG
ncbi:MAG TPA: UvrD-helicase domain-containing protein [Bryobacteraceae bacterium]|nr:UvrD-helicase domain-containing protein [Bryobacteraceae bacterium]